MKTILASVVLLLASIFSIYLCDALPAEGKTRKHLLGIFSPNDIGRPKGVIDGQYSPTSPKSKWPNATVYWAYDPASAFSAAEKAMMEMGMQSIANVTCIKFIPRTTQTGYVNIQSDLPNCMALIGYQGFKQHLNMAKGCFDEAKTFQHEVMHSLGFQHEQTRYDRDMYLEILWDNIEEDSKSEFQKHPRTQAYPPYEYDVFSIMQYYLTAFGTKGRPSMVLTVQNNTIDENQIGRAQGMMKSDINRVRSAYKCDYQGEGARVPTNTR